MHHGRLRKRVHQFFTTVWGQKSSRINFLVLLSNTNQLWERETKGCGWIKHRAGPNFARPQCCGCWAARTTCPFCRAEGRLVDANRSAEETLGRIDERLLTTQKVGEQTHCWRKHHQTGCSGAQPSFCKTPCNCPNASLLPWDELRNFFNAMPHFAADNTSVWFNALWIKA